MIGRSPFLLPVLALASQAWVATRRGQSPRRSLRSPNLLVSPRPPAWTQLYDLPSRTEAIGNGPSAIATPTTITGYVTAVRGFGKSFCFVDILPTRTGTTVQAILKRQDYCQDPEDDDSQSNSFPAVRRVMLPGVKLRIQGVMVPSRNLETNLLIHKATVIGWPRNPQHVRIVLERIHQGGLPHELTIPAPCFERDSTQNGTALTYLLAKQIVANLTQDEDYPHEVLSAIHAGDHALPLAPEHLRQTPQQVLLDGFRRTALNATIKSRRRYQDNTLQLELVAEEPSEQTRFLCVLHPDLCHQPGSQVVGNLLAPTSRILVDGFIMPPSVVNDMPVLWATNWQLLRASWQPKTLTYMLEVTRDGYFDKQKAAAATNMSLAELESVLKLPTKTERQWKAAELSHALQALALSEDKQLMTHKDILCHFQSLRELYPIEAVGIGNSDIRGSNRKYSNDGSRWRLRKEPQLVWMLQQVQQVAEKHPEYGLRPIQILDIGGGKGLLANFLASKLTGVVEITVVDIAYRAIKNGAMRSKRLQLPVEYKVSDASQIRLEKAADIVVALHACGALTDVAIGHAVMKNASFVICPCCFCSHPHLKVPFIDQDYNFQHMEVYEWLDIEKDQMVELKKIAEIQGNSKLASQAIHSICALRARAAERTQPNTKVTVKTFPITYSTRNFCLIGQSKIEKNAGSASFGKGALSHDDCLSSKR